MRTKARRGPRICIRCSSRSSAEARPSAGPFVVVPLEPNLAAETAFAGRGSTILREIASSGSTESGIELRACRGNTPGSEILLPSPVGMAEQARLCFRAPTGWPGERDLASEAAVRRAQRLSAPHRPRSWSRPWIAGPVREPDGLPASSKQILAQRRKGAKNRSGPLCAFASLREQMRLTESQAGLSGPEGGI